MEELILDKKRPTVWQMVKKAIEDFDRIVSNAEIRDYVLNRYGSVNPNTIDAHITLQAVNAQSRVHYPENQKPRIANDKRYDVLFRLGHGRYEQYKPEHHGIWEIRSGKDGKLKVAKVSIQPASYNSHDAFLPDKSETVVTPDSQRFDWTKLNHLQLGRYAEYFVKMEFTLYGFEVYTSEVDDRGIDFVTRPAGGSFFEVQVKSVRGLNYIFFPKKKFKLQSNLLAAIVIFLPGKQPEHCLIRSTKWEDPDALLVSHDYIGKKSPPEWGLNISRKNLPLLERFRFDKVAGYL